MSIRLSDSFSYKKLLRFTLPSIIMSLFTSLYGVVDGIFVANFAGKTALAAINFVFPLLIILSTFGYMFGIGGSALVSKTFGEGKDKKANSLFSLFVYICIFLSVVFSVVGFFVLRPIMSFFGAEGAMLEASVLYGNILLLTLPFWNLQYLFQIFFVTAERPKLGLYVTLIAGFGNMLLDAVFVGIFKWGLTGAAIATAISQFAGGGLPLIYFFSKNSSQLRLGKTRIDLKAILKATSNGSSEFVAGVSNSLVSTLYNTQLLKYSGENGVAAYGAIMYVCMIFIGVFFGYANGSAPIVGYHFGAKNRGEVKNLLKKGLTLTISASIIMFTVSILLSKPLSALFAGYDPELYEITFRGFRIYSISFIFSGVAILGSSFFTALNNGLISATLSFLRTILFQVGCVLLFPLFFGINGIWFSVVAAEILAVSVTVCFLFGTRKRYL